MGLKAAGDENYIAYKNGKFGELENKKRPYTEVVPKELLETGVGVKLVKLPRLD